MMKNRNRRSRGSVAVWAMVVILALAGSVLWFGIPRTPTAEQAGDPMTAAEPAGIYLPNGHATLFQIGSRASLPDEKGLVPHEGNESGNRRVVQVSRWAAQQAAATKGPLAIQLPTGERFMVQFERSERAPNGDWTFVGKVATRLGPQSAVLTFGRAGLFGVLPVPDGRQMQIATTRGVTVLEPVRPMHPRDPATGQMPVDFVVPQQSAQKPVQTLNSDNIVFQADHATAPAGTRVPMSAARAQSALPTAAVPAPLVQIDVLGFYTKNMVELRGSVAAAETECNNYLATANQAHLDSNTGVKLNFVGLRQVDYPADGTNLQALNDMQANTLPDGTDVSALRDTLRADLVALLRPYANGDTDGGRGSLGPANGYEGAAYSVSNLSSYTFAHETGHNLGSMHDIETSTQNGVISYGAFEYSFGYRQNGPPAFATIMAYQAFGQTQIGYFSHPGTTACLNVACGTAEADSARSMRAMAPVLAEYRLPLNMILITAQSVVEGDPGSLWEREASITVKLSSPAPAGGVSFNVSTENGTAVASADYSAWSQSGVVIPEGASVWNSTVKILPDTQIEGDESFKVVLSNVAGAAVYRGSTDVYILDDDPRVAVTGRLLAPLGYLLPASGLYISVTETGGSSFSYQSALYWVSAPGFDYRIPVQKGSSVKIFVYAEAPYAYASFDLGIVNGDQHRDIVLKPAFKLTGTLRFEAGQPVPTSPINVIAWGADGSSNGAGALASPPNFTYSFDVAQGAEVRLEARDPPSPFVAQQIGLGELWSDRVQDIQVGLVPSMVMSGARISEGARGEEQVVNLGLRLSASAPEDGVQLDVELVNGTAVAGSDFVEKTKTRITLGAGNNLIDFPVVIKGDATAEATEWFKVVLSNPSGAWLPSPEAIVYIENDDFGKKRNDFDGDGYSDMFWRNLADGRNIVWWAADYGIQSNPGQVSLSWSVVGTGDFDGDGKSDLFWRNAANGQNIIWPSGDTSLKRNATTVVSQAWKVATVGDFNGDGRDDIFWRNESSGQNIIWWSGEYLGNTVAQSVSTSWKVAGSGDFNGDGKHDVLWRNSASGANIVWWSGKYQDFGVLTAVTNLGWDVVAIGDFDSDGRADMFWRNRVTGENIIWWHGSYSNQVREPTISTAWKIKSSGDYDGDGEADLLWRNSSTGQNVIWDSGRYANRRNLTGVTNLSWTVQP